MVNWKSLDAKDRLLAALVAAHPDKKLLDYRRIATYYGQGTTYDSIEGQFRIIRKEAQKLRDAVESGEHAQAPPRGRAAADDSTTPKSKPLATPEPRSSVKGKKGSAAAVSGIPNGVISGRVTKAKSPPKGGKTKAAAHAPAPVVQVVPPSSDANQIMGWPEDIMSSESSVAGMLEEDGMDVADLDPFDDTDWAMPFSM